MRRADEREAVRLDAQAPWTSGWSETLSTAVTEVCRCCAAHADGVDAQARFPVEAVNLLKARRLLGLLCDGVDEPSLATVASISFRLARACGSTAMIFAMHNTQVACLARHGGSNSWQAEFARRVEREQLLLAGSTTDAAHRGDARHSQCALDTHRRSLRLVKDAGVISYGAEADGILATARRAPDAPSSDQVLVALTSADYRLEPTRDWNAMGMRGTCSRSFRLAASLGTRQVFGPPYAVIHERTMLPVGHLLWCSVWLGIAAEALDRGRRKLRAGGPSPSFAGRALVGAASELQSLRGAVAAAIRDYAALDASECAAFAAQTRFNLLKVRVSRGALAVALEMLNVVGLDGYRDDSEFSIGRHVRDLCSAPLMVGNERILEYALGASLLLDTSPGLFDVAL